MKFRKTITVTARKLKIIYSFFKFKVKEGSNFENVTVQGAERQIQSRSSQIQR